MIRVGIAGIGFMGMIHFEAYRKVRGAKVAAIYSRSEKKRAGDWRGIQGNFGPPGSVVDLKGIAAHATYEELLADSKVDVVDICLPPDQHAEAAIQALQAGKHVLCEKPIALSTREADAMVEAARKAKRQLLIGHVLPFFPEYRFLHEAVQRGKYGRLLGGHFKRVINEPAWLPDFFNPRVVGGPLVDLHIHDAHLIRMLCGMPRAVFSQGRMRGEVAEFATTQFIYDDGPQIAATSGVIRQAGRAFTHAFEVHFERATLLYDFSVIGGEPVTSMPLTVLDAKGGVQRPTLGSGDPVAGFVAELNEMQRAIAQGRPSPILDGPLARDALLLCHKQQQSVRQGRLVKV